MTIREISLALPAILLGAALLVLGVKPVHAAQTPIDNDCSGGYVAFTFDDGPGPNTPAVLQALEDLNLKATFFVNGKKLNGSAAGRQAVRDELAGGFSVQNHTYDHASFTGASTGTQPLSAAQIKAELEDTSAAVRPPWPDLGVSRIPRPNSYRRGGSVRTGPPASEAAGP